MSGQRGRAVAAILLALLSVRAIAETAAQAAEEPLAASAAVSEALPAAAPGALPPGFDESPRENPFRRFEIIAFGAFPIMLFYTDVGFDLHNYIAQGFDYRYAPWPFKNSSYSIEPDQDELFLRIAVAAGVSLTFAGIDAVIRAARARSAAPRPAPSAGQ